MLSKITIIDKRKFKNQKDVINMRIIEATGKVYAGGATIK